MELTRAGCLPEHSRDCHNLLAFRELLERCLADSGGQHPGGGGQSPQTWRGAAADDIGPGFGDAASSVACDAAAARLIVLLPDPA